jgi:hypothetical protein
LYGFKNPTLPFLSWIKTKTILLANFENYFKSNKFRGMCLQIILPLAFFLFLSISIWYPAFYLFVKIWQVAESAKMLNPSFLS